MEKEEIELEFYKTREELVDIFTKPLSIENFNRFREILGMYDFSRLKGNVKNI